MRKKRIIAGTLALAIYMTGSISGVGTVWATMKQDGMVVKESPVQITEDSEFDALIHGKEVDVKNQETMSYTLYEDGTLYIKKTVLEMEGTVETYTVPEDSSIQVKHVYIEDDIGMIGNHAFENSALEDIRIPDSVKTIGSYAFWKCSKLESITLPSGVQSIGFAAFREATGLKNIQIPDSVTSIGNNVFEGCTGLETISLPDSILNIGSYTFYGCSNLKNVNLPKNIEEIGDNVFLECSSLEQITIPAGVEYIGKKTFSDCSSLQSVILPDSVKTIGEETFMGCTNLQEVQMSDGVEKIGMYAFAGCMSLKDISISKNVKSIGMRVFSGCNSLEEVVLPDGVESIDFEAFLECSNLNSITIPSSVIYINDEIHYNDSNERIYGGVFDGCAKLKIYAPSGSYAEEYAKEKGIPVENVGTPVEKPELQPHLGDANQDKSLTAEDALVILKVVVGLEKEEDYEKKYLDANQDNMVTAEDALLDLKKVVGLEPLHDFNWVVSDNTRTMICSQCGEIKGHTETLYGDKWGYYDTEMTNRLFEWCNNSRQQAQYVERDPIGNVIYVGNVKAVSRDSSLDSLAASRAVEVLSNWSHNGVNSYYTTENLAKGYSTIFDTVCAWSASKDHAGTMVYQYYTKAGAAWFWYDQDGTGENLVGVAVMEYGGSNNE